MNEDQLNALANTIYLYESGQIDLTSEQVRDLKQMSDAVGFSFSPKFSAGRAALAGTNKLLFGIPGAAAGLFGQSEIFEPMSTGENVVGGIADIASLLLGGTILKKVAAPLVGTALKAGTARDAAVRTAAALRSTGLPGTRRAAQAVVGRGKTMQEAISSGLGYGGAGALQGLFDPQGTLLGGFTENAFYGALAPAAGKLFGKAKSASKAAKGSSPAKASDINMERVKEVAEELRVQEAMEKAAEVQAAAQAAAANAAASSAIMRLRGSSKAVRGANVIADRIGVPGESLVLSRLQQRPVRGVDPRLTKSPATAAGSSAGASERGRAGRAIEEEVIAQEAVEQAAAAQLAAQAAAAQAAAASAIMGLRGSSRAVRGANFTPNSKGLFARLEEAFDTGANSLNSLFGGFPREQFIKEMRLRDIGSAKLRQSYLRQGMPGYSNRPYPLPRSLYSE